MHVPVLLNEVLEIFAPKTGDRFIDATAGGGGHTIALAERVGKVGSVLAIDWDKESIARLETQLKNSGELGKRIILAHGNFADIEKIAQAHHFSQISGILFDLGFSSTQIEESGRGFSFNKESEPLDMRFDASDTTLLTAGEIIAQYSTERLTAIFREYGEERYARPIARHIKETQKLRPIKTVGELVGRIGEITPARKKIGRIHFATRVFQALRIEVNGELENIKLGLAGALALAENAGMSDAKIAAISFHSLEDRITKHTFRAWQKENRATVLTKKPIVAKASEIAENPRARSAKLRGVAVV